MYIIPQTKARTIPGSPKRYFSCQLGDGLCYLKSPWMSSGSWCRHFPGLRNNVSYGEAIKTWFPATA